MADLLLHVVRSLLISQAPLSNSCSSPLLGSNVKTIGKIKHDDRQYCLPRRSLPLTRSLKAFPLVVSSPFPSALLVWCQGEESDKKWRWPQAALQAVFCEVLAFFGVRGLVAQGWPAETKSRNQVEKHCENNCRYPVLLKTFQSFNPEDKICPQQHVPPALWPTCHLLPTGSFTAL